MRFALLLLLAASFFLPRQCLSAQVGGSDSAGMNPAMLKLFGKNTAFTAQTTVRITSKPPASAVTLPMTTSFLAGKLRQDMEMSKASGVPPESAKAMKQLGMDKISFVLRTDKKLVYVIYPGRKGYQEIEMRPEDAASIQNDPVLQAAPLGKETVDGKPCNKNLVTITDAQGKKQELIVWNTADPRQFPVQIQMVEAGKTTLIQYRNVKFTKPNPRDFDIPVGYKSMGNVSRGGPPTGKTK